MTAAEIAEGLSEKGRFAIVRLAHLGVGADGRDTLEIGTSGATMMSLVSDGLAAYRIDRVFRRCFYWPTDLGREVAALLKRAES